VRAWARSTGIDVTDRGRLRPEILQAWRDANNERRPENWRTNGGTKKHRFEHNPPGI
jgi:hypothetical protein